MEGDKGDTNEQDTEGFQQEHTKDLLEEDIMMQITAIIKRKKLKTKGNIKKIIQDNIWRVMQKIKKRAT